MSAADPRLKQPARRRLVLAAGAALAAPAWLSGCATAARPVAANPAGASARPGDDDTAWLNRVTWGVDSAALAGLQRVGRREYLQGQLHPVATPVLPPAVQAQIDALTLTTRTVPQWVADMEQRRKAADALDDLDARKAGQAAYQQSLTQVAREASSRALLLALYSPNQLQEQLTWFWFNHFNVHQYKANLRVMVGDYEATLRRHALGRFRDLLIASATHPAMIRYLDNEQNAARRINENYAREVMELHTLGVDAGYTQRDVQELARVLTGLGLNFSDNAPKLTPAQQAQYVRTGATEFNPARHDAGEKTVLGQTIPAGGGFDEIIDQLTRLARHPATARFVCRKLAVYLVADDPPAPVVARMVDAFMRSDGDIAVTLQAMFDAPALNDSLGRKFKDPVHYVVSAVRLAYDGRSILNTAPLLGWLNRLGQGLYNRQTPDGYPMTQAAWSSSGQLNTRFEIARAIGSNSAGLFRAEGSTADAPAFPQLSNALFHQHLASRLGERTRNALGAASSPQEWNVVLLSSPEFMFS